MEHERDARTTGAGPVVPAILTKVTHVREVILDNLAPTIEMPADAYLD